MYITVCAVTVSKLFNLRPTKMTSLDFHVHLRCAPDRVEPVSVSIQLNYSYPEPNPTALTLHRVKLCSGTVVILWQYLFFHDLVDVCVTAVAETIFLINIKTTQIFSNNPSNCPFRHRCDRIA